MNDKDAIAAFGALAQAHRLAVFRLLVRTGPAGLAAGEIADAIGVPASTLSHHLAILERASLLTSRRAERRIIYAIDVPGTRGLIDFLSEDCCNGRPELCGLMEPGPSGDGGRDGGDHDDDGRDNGDTDQATATGRRLREDA